MIKKSNIKYYSQNGEDYLVWNLFDYKEKGFYVEVGAFDGMHFSNTFSFEQAGWAGICIEPHPTFFPFCQKNRPDSTCINAACVGDESLKEVSFNAEEIGLLSGISADEDDVDYRYSARKLDFKGFNKVTVPAMTLTNILDNHAPGTAIDFMTIDVEGTELDVLKGLDFTRYAPEVLIVEDNKETPNQPLFDYLEGEKGYTFARKIGANVIFTNSESAVKKIKAVNVSNCILTETNHPMGKKFTIKPHHRLKSKIYNRIRNIFK